MSTKFPEQTNKELFFYSFHVNRNYRKLIHEMSINSYYVAKYNHRFMKTSEVRGTELSLLHHSIPLYAGVREKQT